MSQRFQDPALEIETPEELQALVERLRTSKGLDAESVDAIAELTGMDEEMVRLAIARSSTGTKRGLVQQTKSSFVLMDPSTKLYVTTAWLALLVGICHAAAALTGDRSGFFNIGMLAFTLVSSYGAINATKRIHATYSGMIWGGAYLLSYSLALAVADIFFRIPQGPRIGTSITIFCVATAMSSFGWVAWRQIGKRLGLRSDKDSRLELLKQLVEIQDQLKASAQHTAFLSVDVVGSTVLKKGADPLQVEFTFGEYHRYVEAITRRNGGQLHSTAGDGVTCAFPTADAAYRAARQIQSGLFEFNGARNRLGKPIELRVGIDYGVVVPSGQGATDVDFSSVIDHAAHLQKACPVGCVALSPEAAVELGPEGLGLEFADVASEQPNARIWRPRSSLRELNANVPGMPPSPLPEQS